ncbi:MAG: hypothetical protein AAFR77_01485 [Cyanobacteria bacterium J06631_2]
MNLFDNGLLKHKTILVIVAGCLIFTPKAFAQDSNNTDSFSDVSETVEFELPEESPDKSSIFDFIRDIKSINPILDKAKEVVTQINQGSIEDAIYTTLGAIGLVDPQAEANSVIWNEQTPYYNPETSEDVIRAVEAADSHRGQILGQTAQIIFGKEGQQAIEEQNQVIGKTQETATAANVAIDGVYNNSQQTLQNNAQLAAQVRQQGRVANSSKITQEVMKAIAIQNDYTAQIHLGISEQLTLIGENQVYNGLQMEGLNSQLAISNQRQQNVETFLASQISQLEEIDNNQELQIKREIEKENRAMYKDRLGMTRIFIPGLYSDREQTNPVSQVNEQQSDLPESTSNSLFVGLSDALNP